MAQKSGMLFLFFLSVAGIAAETKPKFLFEIPVYPGTAQISSPPSEFSTLELPFVTVEKIYKTTDGKSLDPKAVVGFYREYFLAKGWKSAGGSFTSEPHYKMSVSFFEHLADGTHIQLGGYFYVLVAPKDGMVITFLRQWRHSSADQATLTRMSQILARLDVLVRRLNYRKQQVYTGGPWQEHYISEYLINWQMFGLSDNTVKNISDENPIGLVTVQLMTYRDGDVASLGEFKYQNEFSRQERNLPLPHRGYRAIIRRDKILILIEDASGNRREVVQKLAAGLREA